MDEIFVKVVHIDELASHFHSLKPEAIIAQLNTLLQEKRICGLFDDRGLVFDHN